MRKFCYFKEWLLVENTISQILKSYPPQDIATISAEVAKTLESYAWTHNGKYTKQENLAPLIKLFTYWIYKVRIQNKTLNATTVRSLVYAFTRNTNDFLSYLINDQPNIAKSKFNNPAYTQNDLIKDTEDWHEKLRQQTRTKAAPGRKVLEMANGYYWVSLDKDYCNMEGDAMGHCGNVGRKQGDNIYSMRDAKGIPHLTFIVNNQILGESKGYGNEKPEPKYHKHIVAFLLGQDQGKNIVEFIQGGGYAPENNFHFNDLSIELQQEVLSKKPYINDYMLYLEKISNGDMNKFKSLLDDTFNFKFTRIDPETKVVVLKEFEYLSPLIDWLKEETPSKLDNVHDFESFDHYDSFNVDTKEALQIFDDNADEKTQELMAQVLKTIKNNKEDEDFDMDDVEQAVEDNDELESALSRAAEDGYRMGYESDAYDHITKHFKNEQDEDENGFIIRAGFGGSWRIEISMKDLAELYRKQDGDVTITNDIVYKYKQPYHGYSGFDKEGYNEYLRDQLHEVLHNLQKAVA
jgi:hypothetical protein